MVCAKRLVMVLLKFGVVRRRTGELAPFISSLNVDLPGSFT